MKAPADTAPSRPQGERLRAWAFSTAPAAGRAGAWGRSCARILLIMHAEYFRTHITIRASALTFAILLSIVPLLALSTSILKGLGTDAQLRQAAVRVIEQLVPPPPAATGNAPPPPAELPAEASFSAHLHHAVDLVFDYVDRTNFAALGLIGVIGLIVVVLLVLASIEDAMNAIWHTRRGRSLLRKLMDYLALLLLLPLSINIALAAEAIAASRRIMEQVSLIVPSAWLAALLIKLVPFLCVVLTLMFLYLFFPHTRVHTGAAFAGALFAAVFWFIVQKIYVAPSSSGWPTTTPSTARSPPFRSCSSGCRSAGPSSCSARCWPTRSSTTATTAPRAHSRTPQRRLQTAMEVLLAVYADFARRQPSRLAAIAGRIPGTGPAEVETVARQLARGGLLDLRGESGEETLVPVTPAENLRGAELVRLVLGDETPPTDTGRLAAVAAAGRSLDAGLDLARQTTSAISAPSPGAAGTNRRNRQTARARSPLSEAPVRLSRCGAGRAPAAAVRPAPLRSGPCPGQSPSSPVVRMGRAVARHPRVFPAEQGVAGTRVRPQVPASDQVFQPEDAGDIDVPGQVRERRPPGQWSSGRCWPVAAHMAASPAAVDGRDQVRLIEPPARPGARGNRTAGWRRR